ncbi:MAG: CDGSH iron-sulfur domain-containing protein, partial [Chloroflexota bacterium]
IMPIKTKTRAYKGENITVTYDIKRCIHAAACVRGLPAVFDTEKRPWVQPDEATADEVAEAVLACPSGALQFERHDGGANEATPEKNIIWGDPNGPLYAHGDIELIDSEGEVILEDTRVGLCRCGASENKPFCDGTHNKIAFQDSGDLTNNSLGGGDDGDSKVKIRTAPNGPLLLQGQVEVCSADKQTVFEGNKGALCRCGGSNNKPFCDGTHVSLGFEAE